MSDGSTVGDQLPAGGSPIPEGLDATLVLVRHGESEWIREGRFQGQAETPLSELGLRQAALAGERLARPHASPALPVPGGRPVEIVHSPLARTAATARADRRCARPGMPDPARRPSRCAPNPGSSSCTRATGRVSRMTTSPAAGRRSSRHGGTGPWESVAPGGETLAEVQARVRPALGRVLEHLGRDYPRGTFDRPQVGGYAGVGAGHDQPWSVLVGHDGVFKVVMLTLFGLPLTQFWMFSLGLTGMSVVEFRGGRPVLRAHNLTAHLAPIEDEQAREAAEQRARSGALSGALRRAPRRAARPRRVGGATPHRPRRRRPRRNTRRSSETRRRRVAARTMSRRSPPRCTPAYVVSTFAVATTPRSSRASGTSSPSAAAYS